MLTRLSIELAKLTRKPRTYLGFAGMAGITCLLMIGFKYGDPFQHMKDRLAQDFIISGSFINAAFLARNLVAGAIYMILPLFTCLVCGDLVASEAADGTLRTILCRPVSRLSVAVSKYMVGAIYVLTLTFGTGVFAYLLGSLFLGRGSLVVMEQGIWVFPEHTALIRLVATYALISVSMLAVGSIAFMISTFLSNANGAIIGAMAMMYAGVIVGEIDYFKSIRPYLFTSYMDKWRLLFISPIDVSELWKAAGVMLIYSAAALIIGLIIFQRRDVLS